MNLQILRFSVLILFFSLSIIVLGQTDEELYQGFQFNFFNPGARAMGMGGAFIGFARDAVSAFINPAGLINLERPQAAAEFKLSSSITPRAAASDSFSNGLLTEFSSDSYVPSFGSFSFSMGNFTAAVSVTNIIKYQEEFTLQARPVPNTQTVLPPATGNINVEGYVIALSVALRLNEYWVFGASTGVSYLDVTAINSVLIVNDSDYSDVGGAVDYETISNNSGTGLFFNFGFLFTPAEKLSIGLSFIYNPPVSFSQDLYISGTHETGLHFNTIEINYDIPDRLGLGIAYKPYDGFVIAADAVYMEYSQITDVMIASYDNNELNIERGENISGLFEYEDSIEFHIGIEYALPLGKYPVYLRAGIFTNPDHRAVYSGTDPVLKYKWNITSYSNEIKKTEYGLSGGLGLTLTEALSIDAAYVNYDANDLIFLSFIYRF